MGVLKTTGRRATAYLAALAGVALVGSWVATASSRSPVVVEDANIRATVGFLEASVAPTAPELALVAQIGGTSWAVAVAGDRGYLGVGLRVVALDITDPPSLRMLGQSAILADMPVAIEVVGETAIVATRNDLYTIDFADPGDPRLLGHLAMSGVISALDVDRDHAYLAQGWAGVASVDISDLAAPTHIGGVHVIGGALGLDVVDDHAFVAAGERGLQVVDVSSPAEMWVVAVADTEGNARSVVVAEGTAVVGDGYVTDGSRAGLRLYDVGDPVSPKALGSLELLDDPYDLHVEGRTAYVADWSGGLVIVDIADPTNPDQLSQVPTSGRAKGVAVGRGHAFIADDLDGLQIFDVTDGREPQRLGRRPFLRLTNGVAADGGFAFVAEGTRYAGGIRMLDISDPLVPREVAHVDTTGSPTDTPGPIDRLDAEGGYVYAVGYSRDGLHVLEATDAPSLRKVGYLPLEFARSVDAEDGFAYIANQTGISVIDISLPAAPRLVAQADVRGAYRVFVADRYLYVAAGQRLHILDVSSPMNPREVVAIDTPATDVFVSADTAYVVGYGGLSVFDVSQKTAPLALGRLSTAGEVTSVTVAGSFAYLTVGQEGALVVDISDPAAPAEVARLDTLEFTSQVVGYGDHLLVAGHRAGLGVLELRAEALPTPTASASPEPTAVPTFSERLYLPLVVRRYAVDQMSEHERTWSSLVDSNHVHDFAFDASRAELWAATYGGAVVWNTETLAYRKLTLESGLASNVVSAVAVDRAGNRWFGTNRGLSRLAVDDTWATYSQSDGLLSDNVTDLMVAADGRVWIASASGAQVLNADGDFGSRVDVGLAAGAVSLAHDPRTGDVWLGHGSFAPGVTRVTTDGRLTRFTTAEGLALPEVSAIAADREGTVWLAASRPHESDSGHLVEAAVVSLVPDGTWSRHVAGDGALDAQWNGGSLSAAYMAALSAPAVDPAAPAAGGLVSLGSACEPEAIGGDVAGRVVMLRTGDCAIGDPIAMAATAGAVAAVVIAAKEADDPLIQSGRRHRAWFPAEAAIPVAMIEAADGAVLNDALAGGASVQVTLAPRAGLIDDFVTVIAVGPDGQARFGTPGGVGQRLVDGGWRSIIDDPFLVDQWVMAMAFDDTGALWIGTPTGLRRLSADGTFTTHVVDDGVPSNAIRAITFGADGTAWIGTWAGGASRRDASGRWSVFRRQPRLAWKGRPDDHFLGDGFVRAIEMDRVNANVWFATERGAVALEPEGVWNRYTMADGLADDWVEDILARADGSMWFATNRGVSVRQPNGAWRSYNEMDGLLSQFVRQIAEDADGGLWFGTVAGVSRLAPDGRWTSLTEADGIYGTDVQTLAIDRDGTLWLGTNLGISARQPDGTWRSFPTRAGVKALTADPVRGGIWFCSVDGAEHIMTDGSRKVYGRPNHLLADWVRAVGLDIDGRVWCGTGSNGVLVVDVR